MPAFPLQVKREFVTSKISAPIWSRKDLSPHIISFQSALFLLASMPQRKRDLAASRNGTYVAEHLVVGVAGTDDPFKVTSKCEYLDVL